ncbi:MAG: hypothetical protein ACRD40_04195 [Candidatus Acidiferrales bacterium]
MKLKPAVIALVGPAKPSVAKLPMPKTALTVTTTISKEAMWLLR